MIHHFTECGPDRIVSGIGALRELPGIVEQLGVTRVLVLTGRTLATKTDLAARVERTLGTVHVGTFAECGKHLVDAGYGAPDGDIATRDALTKLLDDVWQAHGCASSAGPGTRERGKPFTTGPGRPGPSNPP